MIKIICVSLLACFALNSSLWSADFSWSGYKEVPNEEVVLTIKGEITKGDSEKLLKQVMTHRFISEVVLDSPGGSVSEALQMASTISGLRITTRVASEKLCASSCFFLFLAGEPRQASGMTTINGIFFGRVGLHRPYLTKEFFNNNENLNSTKTQEELMVAVKKYLEKQMVPNYLIETMMSRSSSEIYLLSDKDLQSLGEVYPPREELFTAKCGYKKNQTFDPILMINLSKELKCVNEIKIIDQSSFFEKLKTGWKPWNSEVATQRRLTKSFTNKEATIYIDKNSFERNGSLVKYVEIIDLKEPNRHGSGELKIVINSWADQYEVDCNRLRMRVLNSIAYSDSMGKGQIVLSDFEARKYVDFQTGSNIHKLICSK